MAKNTIEYDEQDENYRIIAKYLII